MRLHLVPFVLGLLRHLLQRGLGGERRLGQGADTHRQLVQAFARLLKLGFEIGRRVAFMGDGRLFGFDLLQYFGSNPSSSRS